MPKTFINYECMLCIDIWHLCLSLFSAEKSTMIKQTAICRALKGNWYHSRHSPLQNEKKRWGSFISCNNSVFYLKGESVSVSVLITVKPIPLFKPQQLLIVSVLVFGVCRLTAEWPAVLINNPTNVPQCSFLCRGKKWSRTSSSHCLLLPPVYLLQSREGRLVAFCNVLWHLTATRKKVIKLTLTGANLVLLCWHLERAIPPEAHVGAWKCICWGHGGRMGQITQGPSVYALAAWHTVPKHLASHCLVQAGSPETLEAMFHLRVLTSAISSSTHANLTNYNEELRFILKE